MRVAVVALLSVLCTVSASAELPPRKQGALLRWLRAGSYQQTYTPEPSAHRSLAPTAHGLTVRSWYNRTLVDDLRAGRMPFRRGAAMVKELHAGDGQVVGWAVMRKLRRRSGRNGAGWFFYERFSTGGQFAGRGLRVCTGCHGAGTDFLLSPSDRSARGPVLSRAPLMGPRCDTTHVPADWPRWARRC